MNVHEQIETVCKVSSIPVLKLYYCLCKAPPYPLMYLAHLSLRASAPTRHDGQFNEQPNNPEKGPAIPRKEYPWCQGPSLKEKPKQETHHWGEGSDGRIISASRLLEQGPGSLPTPVHPSFPPPPLCKGRGKGEGGEGRGITWVAAESQLIERPLGG